MAVAVDSLGDLRESGFTGWRLYDENEIGLGY